MLADGRLTVRWRGKRRLGNRLPGRGHPAISGNRGEYSATLVGRVASGQLLDLRRGIHGLLVWRRIRGRTVVCRGRRTHNRGGDNIFIRRRRTTDWRGVADNLVHVVPPGMGIKDLLALASTFTTFVEDLGLLPQPRMGDLEMLIEGPMRNINLLDDKDQHGVRQCTPISTYSMRTDGMATIIIWQSTEPLAPLNTISAIGLESATVSLRPARVGQRKMG